MRADDALGSIALGDRPLLVCDVDDVVLEFVAPFERFLTAREMRLIPRSFRLHGNIVSLCDDVQATRDEVQALIGAFFDEQEGWQTPAASACEALASIAKVADVVFLTAMAPRHYAQRRRLLDRLGLAYPLLASEDAKGPLVQRLHSNRRQPLAFVDDMIGNLASVRDSVPECLLVHLQPKSELHRFAPKTPDHAHCVADWLEADALIRRHFDTPGDR